MARSTVEGVIEAGQEIGGNVGSMASAAVTGAVDAAGTIGNTAVRTVRELLVATAAGVKDVAGAILPTPRKPPEAPAEAPRQEREPAAHQPSP